MGLIKYKATHYVDFRGDGGVLLLLRMFCDNDWQAEVTMDYLSKIADSLAPGTYFLTLSRRGEYGDILNSVEVDNPRIKRSEILDKIGWEAAYMQLAEEASELSWAALKAARILDGHNPTPVTMDEAKDMILEEFTDVIHCAIIMDLDFDSETLLRKNLRWWDCICEND